MEKSFLVACLDEGLSLEQIGERAGKNPSTVSYWLRKTGLQATGAERHSPRGAIDRETLELLVEAGLTLREIAPELDRGISTVRYWLRRHGLQTPLSVRRADREQALAEGKRTVTSRCRRHGETVFVIENSGRVRCRRCRTERVSEWRRRTKLKLVGEAGGSCRICGYDRFAGALEFHHLDPAEKSFALSMRGLTRSIQELRREAAKCVLLCANCHAEVEAGFASVE